MESERQDTYKSPEVERFLTDIIAKKPEITPVFDLEFGYRYPDVEKGLTKKPEESREFLERLAKVGVLERKLYAMGLRCPKCESPNVDARYVCPFCGSIDVKKDALIEHVTCGYIDVMTNFKSDGDYVCPKCHNKLAPGSYRMAGSWYAFQAAESGWSPYSVRGDSGVEHAFDMLLLKQSEKIAVDVILSEGPISQVEIIKEYTKVIDTKEILYLIVIPELGDDARKLVEFYKMRVVESASPQGAMETLIRELQERESGKEMVKGQPIKVVVEATEKREGKSELERRLKRALDFGSLLKRRK